MPARPKNDSDSSDDEEMELMQNGSDDEETDDEESGDEQSDDEESEDEDSDDEQESDDDDEIVDNRKVLKLRWQGKADNSVESESNDSEDEEDDDDEESDEVGITNEKASKKLVSQKNDSDDESGEESDDESDDDDEDEGDSDEEVGNVLVKKLKNELKNARMQKQNLGAKQEKVSSLKADKSLQKNDEKHSPKIEVKPPKTKEKLPQTPEKTKKSKSDKPEKSQKLKQPQQEKQEKKPEKPQKLKQPQQEKQEKKKKIPFEQTKQDLEEKYARKRGKSLYVRFPKRLPTDQAELEKYIKDICSRVINVRRPRQPAARFCLIDFDNNEDCKKAYKDIRKIDVDGKRLHVQVPRTDSKDFIEEIMDRRRQKLKEMRAKKKLRKALGPEKKEKNEKVFTTAITVRNIPISASVEEVKNNFPEAIEFKLFYAKKPQEANWAVVTLPTTQDATKAKRQKIIIDGKPLTISFAGQQKAKPSKKNQKKLPKPSNDTNTDESKEEKSSSPVTNQKKKEKRKADTHQDKQIQSKKVKHDTEVSPNKEEGKNQKKKNDKKLKKQHKHEQTSLEEGHVKKLKEQKTIDNGNLKPITKNENSSFEKKNKQKFDENVSSKQKQFHNKGKIGSDQNQNNKFGKKFGNKDKGFQNQHKKKNMKGEFSKGRNESKKGKFHMKAMRP